MDTTASSASRLPVRPLVSAGIPVLMVLTLFGASFSAAPAVASAGTAGANAAVTVRITGVPAAASEIVIEAQSPLTRMGAPNKLRFYSLVTVSASGGTTTATIPPSRLLTAFAAAQHGWVNLAAVAVSATRTYGRMFPVHLRPGGVATATVAHLSRVSFHRARSIPSSAAPKVDACTYLLVNPRRNRSPGSASCT